MEDARGIIAAFGARQIRENDCVPAVRAALAELDAVLERTLEHAAAGTPLSPQEREALDRAARSLLLLWSKCGEQSKALMLDIKTVFGRYLTIAGP